MTQLDEICPSSWTWNNWINLHDVSRCINFIHGIECNIHEISSMIPMDEISFIKTFGWKFTIFCDKIKFVNKIRSKILYHPWNIIHSKIYFNLYNSLKFHGWISMKYNLWIPMDDWPNFPLKITTHPWDFIDKIFSGKFIQWFELWKGELNML
jgi:hypothetical protein